MYKEALMSSIFGKFSEASKKLKLIITLAPDNPDPYHLLGTMHEEIGTFIVDTRIVQQSSRVSFYEHLFVTSQPREMDQSGRYLIWAKNVQPGGLLLWKSTQNIKLQLGSHGQKSVGIRALPSNEEGHSDVQKDHRHLELTWSDETICKTQIQKRIVWAFQTAFAELWELSTEQAYSEHGLWNIFKRKKIYGNSWGT